MWCPSCGELEDRVVDSRASADGRVIRRRRECVACGERSTTFERLEMAPVVVRKRDGSSVAFDADKIVTGVLSAAKHRPVTEEQGVEIAEAVEEAIRSGAIDASTEHIGASVLKALRDIDEVTYLRFASVYKAFDDPSDFEREALELAIERQAAGEPVAVHGGADGATSGGSEIDLDAAPIQDATDQATPTPS